MIRDDCDIRDATNMQQAAFMPKNFWRREKPRTREVNSPQIISYEVDWSLVEKAQYTPT